METIAETSRAPAVVFANSKGGVGKSTLAFLSALYLAANGKRIAFLDLDDQKTGESSLARFADGQFISICDADEGLSLPAAVNGTAGGYDPTAGCGGNGCDLIVIDTPAGLDPGNLAFLQPSDLLLIPCSESDFDLAATRRFLNRLSAGLGIRLEATRAAGTPRPSILIAPNLVPDESAYRRIKSEISLVGAMPPVTFAPTIRKALESAAGDLDIVATLKRNDAFFRKLLAWAVQVGISRARRAEAWRYAEAASA